MNSTKKQIKPKDRRIYEAPTAQPIVLLSEDILTASNGDNLGEWDSQEQ